MIKFTMNSSNTRIYWGVKDNKTGGRLCEDFTSGTGPYIRQDYTTTVAEGTSVTAYAGCDGYYASTYVSGDIVF